MPHTMRLGIWAPFRLAIWESKAMHHMKSYVITVVSHTCTQDSTVTTGVSMVTTHLPYLIMEIVIIVVVEVVVEEIEVVAMVVVVVIVTCMLLVVCTSHMVMHVVEAVNILDVLPNIHVIMPCQT